MKLNCELTPKLRRLLFAFTCLLLVAFGWSARWLTNDLLSDLDTVTTSLRAPAWDL
jgi:hypothetical protein